MWPLISLHSWTKLCFYNGAHWVKERGKLLSFFIKCFFYQFPFWCLMSKSRFKNHLLSSSLRTCSCSFHQEVLPPTFERNIIMPSFSLPYPTPCSPQVYRCWLVPSDYWIQRYHRRARDCMHPWPYLWSFHCWVASFCCLRPWSSDTLPRGFSFVCVGGWGREGNNKCNEGVLPLDRPLSFHWPSFSRWPSAQFTWSNHQDPLTLLPLDRFHRWWLGGAIFTSCCSCASKACETIVWLCWSQR